MNIDVLFFVFLFLVIFNTWIVWHRKKIFFLFHGLLLYIIYSKFILNIQYISNTRYKI
jgi:hypothetical protein